jgi:uncharacterized protein
VWSRAAWGYPRRRTDASAWSTQSSSTVENITPLGDTGRVSVTRAAVPACAGAGLRLGRTYGVRVTVLSTIDDVAGERFVSLTTFRRDGTPVATPVWIARDGDALVVTTPADSGKVKRLRRDPRVEMQSCDRRGRVPEGAVPVAGVAEVVSPESRHVAALRRKYGMEYRIITAVERLVRGRRERVILRIRLDQATS